MKPPNRMKGRLTFPTRADHVLERIRIMTRELESIQAEIYGRMHEGLPADQGGLLHDDHSTRVLDQFRTVLDQVRNMLWLCAEAMREGTTKGLQRDRQVAQAAALLRALAPSGPRPSSATPATSSSNKRESGAQDPISFFDRLDRVIDNYVEGGGALVEPTPRRSPKT